MLNAVKKNQQQAAQAARAAADESGYPVASWQRCNMGDASCQGTRLKFIAVVVKYEMRRN